MKTAIFFCGSIRDFPTCLPSLQRYVLNNLDADIFLHLWKMEDVSKLDTNVDFKWKNDSCKEQYVLDQLKPVRYIIDTYTTDWENRILQESGVDMTKMTDPNLLNYGVNSCGMYYKIYEAFRMVEDYSTKNKIKYDIVIRARLDFIWEDHVHISDFNNATDNTIFLIRDKYATYSRLETNDKFFGGTYNAMKKMCNLFNCIKSYQMAGVMVEGQSLNQKHIKSSNLHVKWIGHANTYYKCMGRHSVKNNHKHILVGNNCPLDNFFYEMSYYLLYNDYNVVYMNKISTDDKKIKNLLMFRNFKFYDSTIDLDKINCFIGNCCNNNLKTNQIIILDTPETADTNNKITKITINKNIFSEQLVDFIETIIKTQKYGNSYTFTDTFVADPIAINEPVIFKYLDHGYYTVKISAYDPGVKKYKMILGKTVVMSTRENIKIINLLKYYNSTKPTLMPVNLHKNKHIITLSDR